MDLENIDRFYTNDKVNSDDISDYVKSSPYHKTLNTADEDKFRKYSDVTHDSSHKFNKNLRKEF
jgi:hypothetical protein